MKTKKILTMRTILVIVELEPVEEASILKGPSWKKIGKAFAIERCSSKIQSMLCYKNQISQIFLKKGDQNLGK